jgi:hypothetical protein
MCNRRRVSGAVVVLGESLTIQVEFAGMRRLPRWLWQNAPARRLYLSTRAGSSSFIRLVRNIFWHLVG